MDLMSSFPLFLFPFLSFLSCFFGFTGDQIYGFCMLGKSYTYCIAEHFIPFLFLDVTFISFIYSLLHFYIYSLNFEEDLDVHRRLQEYPNLLIRKRDGDNKNRGVG